MFGGVLTTLQVLTYIVSFGIPMLVALVTKYEASNALRSILLLVLSTAAGFIDTYITHTDNFDWNQAVNTAVTTFLLGVGALLGIQIPFGINSALKRAGGFISDNGKMGQLRAKYGEWPYAEGRTEAGYATLGWIGFMAAVVALILLILVAASVATISLWIIVIVLGLGLLFMILDSRVGVVP